MKLRCKDLWANASLPEDGRDRRRGVAYSKDIPGLHEYYYPFRKIWEDQKQRQMLSKEEALGLLTLHEKAI
jgi:hypothetical protein